MFGLSRKNKNQLLENKYKDYRNRLNTLLRVAEKDHYANLFEENKSNLRNSWRILQEVINKKKKSKLSSKFIVDGKCITDKNDIANKFNSFFVNIGPNLPKKIPDNPKPCTQFIKCGQITDVIFSLPPVRMK